MPITILDNIRVMGVFSNSKSLNRKLWSITMKRIFYIDPYIVALNNNIGNCVIGPQLPFDSINPSLYIIKVYNNERSGVIQVVLKPE